jgi:hypothetical protein
MDNQIKKSRSEAKIDLNAIILIFWTKTQIK